MLALLVTHPFEFRTLLQYKLWHEGTRDITAPNQLKHSGWDRQSMRRCWEFLDDTSRSFAGVIKELDGDLARVICLFYLVLRALDTIEDDMTLLDETKQPLLRTFHVVAMKPGWTFTQNGPGEKDRQVLVEFNVVSDELNLVEERYRNVIVDTTKKMGIGMADYAHRAVLTQPIYLETIADYDLYCHFVAGIVGEGLTRLWSASGKEVAWLGEQLELANSMGLMLQKTNIIRDYREDVEERRYFWPREIWGREIYGTACGRPAFKDMEDMYKPGNEQQALWALSGMVVDVLGHAVDSLDYLRLLKTQTVFNFCAIPQTMAIATLGLCFMNYDMFQRNIKIRRAEAASLIMRSSNPRDVAYIFRDYARRIHQKAIPEDPSFLQLSIACGKIEQWCEHYYPSFVQMRPSGQTFDSSDARYRIMEAAQKRDKEMQIQKRVQEISGKTGVNLHNQRPPQELPTWELVMLIGAVFALIIAVGVGGFFLLVKFIGQE
ncbi:Squalene synthase [Sparassis crispa]|uniref:Squalene synthase n=1 Tax=Sparassis crispa TaxID=139825 RepID=A0A401GWN7_9APHY|nr:Squalene synthase [Sparassis crispa]GBE86635.1 Squalene synthase [Sparassis crispa]